MRTRLFSLLSIGLLAASLPAVAQHYAQTNLVSDEAGKATFTDGHLVNAWGLVSSPTSPWWVSNNGTLTSTLYDGNGVARALVVSVPGPPTGVVFNGGTGFVVRSGAASGAARFIFATEDGKIAGWSPNVPAAGSTQATVGSDQSARGAVYKGLAIATTVGGSFLYAADFHNGAVDIFDSSFALVGSFTDERLPHGYAPFGIQAIGSVLYVTFAKQDKAAHDDVPGKGRGFVDAFDTSGSLLQRVASRGSLNSPWGIALAPATFGAFAGDLLIGNFGDGKINAFNPVALRENGQLQSKGQLLTASCSTLTIDGLWALQFGNGSGSGSKDTLYFTAGPDGESHGLFGELVPTSGPSCGHPKDDDGDDAADE
jgi:uncharacterized protein (TIGR03118 family)